MRTFALVAISIVSLAIQCVAIAEDQRGFTGQWTGWLYMDDGDVPFRVVVDEIDNGPRARIDLPASGSVEAEFAIEIDDDRMALMYPSADDPRVRIELQSRGASHAVGAVAWFGVDGRAEVHRAETRLPHENKDDAARLLGIYGAPGDPGVIIQAQHWGELLLVDPESGDERTLFKRLDGSYITGPALYVPAPVERVIKEVDLDGKPALRITDQTGERVISQRSVHKEEIVVERDGARLVGEFTHPVIEYGPVAIIAGGSSWTDRERVRWVSSLLAAYGIGSVIYDKRGYGDSKGDQTVPFATTAADLVAFASAVRSRPGVDPTRVGYLGISRGGWYGAIAAGLDTKSCFFVSNVGPAVSPIQQETTARLARMQERGASDEDIALAQRYLRSMWTYARTETAGDEYLSLQAEVDAAGWRDMLLGPSDLEPSTWQWLRTNGDFDQRAALNGIDCPVLALFGEEDLAVSTAVNAPLMRDELWRATTKPVEVHVIPGSDHSLRRIARDADGTRLPYHRSIGRHPDAWSTTARFILNAAGVQPD